MWQRRTGIYRAAIIIAAITTGICTQGMASSSYPPPPGAYRPVESTKAPSEYQAAVQAPAAQAPMASSDPTPYPAPSAFSPVPEVDPAYANRSAAPVAGAYENAPIYGPSAYPAYQATPPPQYQQPGQQHNKGPSFNFDPGDFTNMMPTFSRNNTQQQMAPGYGAYPPAYDYYPQYGYDNQPAYGYATPYPEYDPAYSQQLPSQGYQQTYVPGYSQYQQQGYSEYPEYAPSGSFQTDPNTAYTQPPAYPPNSYAQPDYGTSAYATEQNNNYPQNFNYAAPSRQNMRQQSNSVFRPPELQGTD